MVHHQDTIEPDRLGSLGLFDDVPDPIYYDPVHTGERGASLVAAAIYANVRADLESRIN